MEMSVVNDDPAQVIYAEEEEPKVKTKRRGPTAYNVFLKVKLEELSKTHPEVPCKERMKMAATAWHAQKGV